MNLYTLGWWEFQASILGALIEVEGPKQALKDIDPLTYSQLILAADKAATWVEKLKKEQK